MFLEEEHTYFICVQLELACDVDVYVSMLSVFFALPARTWW